MIVSYPSAPWQTTSIRQLTRSIPPSRPWTAPLSPLFLVSFPTCLVSNSRTTLEDEANWEEAAVDAEGFVNALVDCLGRVVAARLSAGRRRNIVVCGVWCIQESSVPSRVICYLFDQQC